MSGITRITLDAFQQSAVDAVCSALASDGRALLVAPTGAGKTVMMGDIITRHHLAGGRRTLVLQRRVLIGRQNRAKIADRMRSAIPDARVGICNGEESWKDMDAPVIVATVGSIGPIVDYNIGAFGAFDLIVIDEAHNAVSKDFTTAIDALRMHRPDARLLGPTATPERADGKGLAILFGDQPAAVVTLADTIMAGRNVPPDARAITFSDDAVSRALADANWSDTDAASSDIDVIIRPALSEVVAHWHAVAGSRRTICFCPSIDGAEHLADAFVAAGVDAAVISTRVPAGKRKRLLADVEAGRGPQVLTCATLLMEGFDAPPVSCVVLLRGFQHKSTLIQAVGRGLRTAPSKVDCIVLDGVGVTSRHVDIVAGMNLLGRVKKAGDRPAIVGDELDERPVVEALGGDLVAVEMGVGVAPQSDNAPDAGQPVVARSRKEAKALGLKTFFTGNPCVRGHISKRDIYSVCIACRSDPEIRAKQAEYNRRYKSDPENRAKQAEYKRRHTSDPEVRAKYLERTRLRRSDPEVRAKEAERDKRRRSDPEIRAKQAEYNRLRYSDPEVRARIRKKQAEYSRLRRYRQQSTQQESSP